MTPGYATAVMGDRDVIEGVLEDDIADPSAPCCEACGGIHGIEDVLPGSAGKGAAVGATVGSFIPGVGTAVGGAVGAAAGAIADFFGGGGKHCKVNGQEVPCPPCAITDIHCFANWVAQKQKEALAKSAPKSNAPPPWELGRRAQQQAAARKPPPRRSTAMVRHVAPPPPPPRPAPPPIRVEAPRVAAPEHESTLPIALGAAALLAAGGGAWWWWRKQQGERTGR